MSDTMYNGWKNRATWLVNIHTLRDINVFDARMEWQLSKGGTVTGGQVMEYVNSQLAKAVLRDLVKEVEWEDAGTPGHRWTDVDWYQLAEHWSRYYGPSCEMMKEGDINV